MYNAKQVVVSWNFLSRDTVWLLSSFVEFHTPTKIYPNDERDANLYAWGITTVRLSRSVPKKGCVNPSRMCVCACVCVCVCNVMQNVRRVIREMYACVAVYCCMCMCVCVRMCMCACAKGARVKENEGERRINKRETIERKTKKKKLTSSPFRENVIDIL